MVSLFQFLRLWLCRRIGHRVDPIVSLAAATIRTGDTLTCYCVRCGAATGEITQSDLGFSFRQERP